MRRIGAHTVAGVGALLLTAAPAGAAVERTGWAFAGIGPSQTTLRIFTYGGGCARQLAPVVEETARAVRILARNAVPDDPSATCTSDFRFERRLITLRAPLAGRTLLGAASPSLGPPPGPGSLPPHVVGLAPGDAVTVLRTANLRPTFVRRHSHAGLRRVVAQHGTRLVVDGG